MLIIPVIDISQGVVVQATKSDRKSYKPIKSSISDNPDPESILTSYLKLYPFKIIYIADLDAIEGKKNQSKLINRLTSKYKDCEFWLDAGIEQIYNKFQYKSNNLRYILGTENEFSIDEFRKLIDNNPKIILSIDINKKGNFYNSDILNYSDEWPKKVIIMMLHLVGSGEGIDISNIEKIIKYDSSSELFVAGGINSASNIKKLKSMDIKGCLIASALHQKKISRKDLIEYNN